MYRENTIHLERRQKPFEPYRRVSNNICISLGLFVEEHIVIER